MTPRETTPASLPQTLRWTPKGFVETTDAPGQILVADSWRHIDGAARDFARNRARFSASVPLPDTFWSATLEALDQPGELFPRISVEVRETVEVLLRIRQAPAQRAETSLCIPRETDPRIQPRIKGPDIRLLGEFKTRATQQPGATQHPGGAPNRNKPNTTDAPPPADDAVLHDDTYVSETTTGSLVVFPRALSARTLNARALTHARDAHAHELPTHQAHTRDNYDACTRNENTAVFPVHRDQLPSTTAQAFAEYLSNQGIIVVHRALSIDELKDAEHVVFLNALHGVSPVPRIDGVQKERHHRVPQWQRWWREGFIRG